MTENTEDLEAEDLEVEGQEVEDEPREPSQEEIAAQEEAKKYGWRPKEEFDLAPEGWVDADRFLELPSTQNKMLKDELRELKEISTRSEETFAERLDRLDRANKAAMDAALERQKSEYEERMASVLADQRRAAEEGDMDTYDRLERQRLKLEPPKPPEVTAETPTYAAEVEAFREQNEWAKDPVMWDAAVRATQVPGNEKKTVAELLPLAEAAAKRYFPHMFAAPEQKPARPSRVDGAADLSTVGTLRLLRDAR